ncbi:MAG: hypothetical protein ACLGHX_13585 [Acidimicrobiia bacterium]
MAGRLRSHGAALICLVVVALALPAGADETWTCWSEISDRDDATGAAVTRCRIAGSSETTDYGSSSEVPVVLSPQVGTDADGVCWYWTSRSSDWVLFGVDDDGVANLGIDPDGETGGPVIIDVSYPRCVSEPAEAPHTEREAWELLAQYSHPRPQGLLDPAPGLGVVGMEVFVREEPPEPWSVSLTSPSSGMVLEVETYVTAVSVDWGDGSATVVPVELLGMVSGGGLSHVYRTKTCAEPGGPRCHQVLSAYAVEVAFEWVAKYRLGDGEWIPLPVAPTTVTVDYDVDEILPLPTATG